MIDNEFEKSLWRLSRKIAKVDVCSLYLNIEIRTTWTTPMWRNENSF